MLFLFRRHSAGTFDKSDGSGGTNGATMRYEMEANDDANAGLNIARDLLLPVEKEHPDISVSDIWALTGAAAVECTGGPKIPVGLGRVDQTDCNKCPPNGRLPDATQGAQHLRDVFYRMGFDDKDIVCLSGAHTLGRCHKVSDDNVAVSFVDERCVCSLTSRRHMYYSFRIALDLMDHGPKIHSSLTIPISPISSTSSGLLGNGMDLFSTRTPRVSS